MTNAQTEIVIPAGEPIIEVRRFFKAPPELRTAPGHPPRRTRRLGGLTPPAKRITIWLCQ